MKMHLEESERDIFSSSHHETAPLRQRRRNFAAERERMAARSIPELIELLASDSLHTRFLAEMCLRDATGT